MSVTNQQRRQQILTEVFDKRHVTVPELAGLLAVSEATVRRDLKALADEGQLDLVYGGATLVRNSDYSFRSKGQRNVEAKRMIGRLAAEVIADGDQIFLDSGTTCFEIATQLKRKQGLSVIVNSARLVLELNAPGLNVILIGGQYRPDRMDTIGPLAASALDQLRGYVAFIGADGLSPEFGLAAADIESAHFNRQALLNARQCILVADHTKFLAPSLFKIVDWDRIARVITDVRPSDAWIEFLQARNIELTYPAVPAESQTGAMQAP